MPVIQGNITRCDIRVPNELYAEIEKIAIEQFNAKTNWKSGKAEVTSTILSLIRCGIRHISDDMDSGSQSAQLSDERLSELSDRLTQVEEQLLSDNPSDKISDERLKKLADRLAAVETRLALLDRSDNQSDNRADTLSDASTICEQAFTSMSEKIDCYIEQKFEELRQKIEGLETESTQENKVNRADIEQKASSQTQIDKSSLEAIFEEPSPKKSNRKTRSAGQQTFELEREDDGITATLLAKHFGVHSSQIGRWSKSGKLKERGWVKKNKLYYPLNK
jgi:F0F1-type ATP synthase membrane subunit b/b'